MNPRFSSEIGVALAALLVVGALFVPTGSAAGDAAPDDRTATVQDTLRITPDTPGISEEEFMTYAARMERKYGSDSIGTLKSQVQGPPSLPAVARNLRYVSAWTGNLEVENDAGVVLASSDNALVLYMSEENDEQDWDHYYWWQWSAAQNREGTLMGDASNLRNFWNRVAFENATSDLLFYSPDTDIVGAEYTVAIGLGTDRIGKDLVLHQGKVRPKLGECRVGSAGKFAVDWVGNYEGSQSLYGVCGERRPFGADSHVLWTYNLTASQF
jgi:hypothetical protein